MTAPQAQAASTSEPADEPARPHASAPVAVPVLARTLGARLEGEGTAVVEGVTLDSRSVVAGDLWCALPGARAHGADFAAEAADRGAAAALTDAAGEAACRAEGLTVLVSEDPRRDTARASAIVYATDRRRPVTIGVTGTNGKTSITTMVHETLQELGYASGVIGTAGTAYSDAAGREHRIRTVRTTPEAPETHGILARMAEAEVAFCAMEVSSHAMVLHRADEILFDVVCFTNLSQDHLDFHGDMEHYFAAKASLFTPAHARAAVICVDDVWGRRLAAQTPLPTVTYATLPGIEADVRAEDLRPGAASGGLGTAFATVDRDGARHELVSPLPGRHYVANTIAVALVLDALGLAVERTAAAITRSAVVPGRMEQVAETPVRGIVDYSHTEDSLVQALTTLRALPGTRRLLVVMGAGGDRDRAKRPLMGAAAARLADAVVVTDDNPRSEDPASIRRAVLGGIPLDSPAEVHEVADRGEAIARAVRLAGPGDTVLVAGKGAETGQDVGGSILPFDDREHLRTALARAAQEGRPC